MKMVQLAVFLSTSALMHGQILNPSFEDRLNNWTVSGGEIYPVWPASGYAPKGVNGVNVVQLGVGDVPNGWIYQGVDLTPQTDYLLTFVISSVAFTTNTEAKARVMVTNSTANFASNQYSAFSSGEGLPGPWVTNTVLFRTPETNGRVTFFFQDASTNGGRNVDLMIDHLTLTNAPGGQAGGGTNNILFNRSFELGLTGWRSRDVVIYGPPTFTIGTHGTNAAGLGANDAAGSFLEQSFVGEGTYQLTFDIAAMGSAGLRTVTRLEVATDAGILISDTITNFGNGLVPAGSPPFQRKIYTFDLTSLNTNVTLRLLDLTPNNGFGIDTILDNFILFQTASPLRIRLYPGITVSGVVGSRQRVDYVDTVVGSVTNWQTLTNVTLTNASITVIDYSAPPLGRRFYRSVVIP